MNDIRRVSALLLVLLFVVVSAAPAHADEAVLPSGDRLHWDRGLKGSADRVRAALPAIRTRVARNLGLGTAPAANIHVVSGWARMQAAATVPVPEWAAGVCVGSRGIIVLRTDNAESGALRTFEQVLRHEWVHFAWSQAAGARSRHLPIWVEEGLAERIGGGVSVDAGQHLDLAASFNRLLEFEKLKTWPTGATTAGLAYAQSLNWVNYFFDRAGAEAFRSVLRDVRTGNAPASEGPPFEAAVYRHTKRPLNYWIEDWRTSLVARAGPWYTNMFNDLWTSLFLAIAIVGGISYFFIRVRRRRAIAALPDGDFPPGFGSDGELR